jgi:putative Mn2+ efflux pump MntP
MIPLLVLALALAMDAFAVSLVRGSFEGQSVAQAMKLGLLFGLAQGLMPLAGWALGLAFADTFKSFDHWIAFTLLGILGLRMIREGLSEDAGPGSPKAMSTASLFVAALATSIDAAAAGVALPLLGIWMPLACLVIGIVTGTLCVGGYLVGGRITVRAGRRAEIAGGFVLILLGVKILIEHLTA